MPFAAALLGLVIMLTAEPAELIVQPNRIWTGDPAKPWAEAVAIRDGAIVAVGSRAELASWLGPATRVLDRPDDFAVPGLIDAHAHLTGLGAETFIVDLRGATSLEEIRNRIKHYIENHPGNSWVTGRNWDQSLWPGMEFPTARELDVIGTDRPIWLTRIDGHSGWANSAAMRQAGVSVESASPPDGQIHRDASGTPLGLFVDGAMGLVARAIPGPSPEETADRILEAQRRCFAAGLTGVHDAGVDPATAEIFRRLDREKRLKLRVYGMARPAEGAEVAWASKSPAADDERARFRLRAIKLFADGAMGSRGAHLFEPYSDDPSHSGLVLTSRETVRDAAIAALRNGWQLCTHAIGDAANAMVLDAYLDAQKTVPEAKDPRFRVEHAQVVRRTEVPRFAAGRIIASMQPAHAASDKRWADKRLGPARVQGAYAWRWFVDAGVPLAFGSDFPVEIESPLWGIHAALTRQDEQGQPPGGWHPEHRLSLEETLRGFTTGAAYASFDEQRLGAIKVGYRADMTLFDQDFFRIPAERIRTSRVTHTIVDGEIVHSAN